MEDGSFWSTGGSSCGLLIHDLLFKGTFLYAEWVDGPVAWVDDAVLGTGCHDSIVDGKAGVFGNVQLPAELSDERETHGPHLEERGVREEGLVLWREAKLPRVCSCLLTHTKKKRI